MADTSTKDGMDLRAKGRKRIERIDAAYKREKRFFDTAQRAEEIYANEPAVSSPEGLGWNDSYDFNILFSNVETIVPAIINSPPSPDIRRRFNDNDPVAKEVSEILERSMRVQIDDSRMQAELERVAQDAFLAGRGIIRLRYRSEETEKVDAEIDDEALAVGKSSGTDDSDNSSESEETDEDDVGRTVYGERICFEVVSWRDFRRGPAKRWEEVPWMAFRHAIALDDMDSFADSDLMASQTLAEDRLGETPDDVYVWEYWDKKSRQVWFIEENTGKVLKKVDDPLGLSTFFPIPAPVQPIEITGRLMPVTPFAIYAKLAEEVDTISRRIRFLVKAMKVKALYGGNPIDLANIVEGDDADLVPIADAETWAAQGGMDNMLSWWPVERFAAALRELYVAREQAKQAIYEITGISDIVRGAAKSGETATAQQIKTQWGSLRIQKMQRMIERAARDLFVMMAEIIPNKFSAKTIQDMTGIQLIPTEQDQQPLPPPQFPPQLQMAAQQGDQQAIQQIQQGMQQYDEAEKARQAKLEKLAAVNALLQETLQKFYRIDVESDSTVRADLTRQKQEVAEFLQGAAAFWQGIVPAVQAGIMTIEGASEIFASNARMFNLGKSTEDAIDKMIEDAKQKASEPKPPNPEQVKAELEQKKVEGQAQIAQAKAQSDQANMQMQMQATQAKTQGEMAKLQADIEARRIDAQLQAQTLQAKMVADQQAHDMEMQKGQLELVKIQAEIEKIRASTASALITTQAKTELAARSQEFKETQATKEPAE